MLAKTRVKTYLGELAEKWQRLHDTPSVFAYSLNVQQQRYLPGTHYVYSELNPERSTLRRLPQTILSLNPPFEEAKFNFKKIQPSELLMNIPYDDNEISVIINKSPLTRYHMLLCPNVAAGQPQRLTPLALSFSISFLLALEDEPAYRIGYNSPGALASVNHLHLHLMYLEADLYTDKATLSPLPATHTYRLSADMPTEAICFLFRYDDSEHEVKTKLTRMYEFILWLYEQNMPHNLFLTPSRDEHMKGLKVFVFAREKYCVVKDLLQFNIGYCELSGYFPVGSKKLYDSLTEQIVFAKIREEIGQGYDSIYNYFTK